MRIYVFRLLANRFEVETVCDGQAALDAARAQTPDLIVSDVMMPRLDGLELLRRVRADRELREIPVILLSARAGEGARIEGLHGWVPTITLSSRLVRRSSWLKSRHTSKCRVFGGRPRPSFKRVPSDSNIH